MNKKYAYYNDTDPYVCEWTRNLCKAGLILDGEVDERSIADVSPDDVKGFVQCHWFNGVSGWPLALRIAGWPDDRQIFTGSAPCQPFSVAGKQLGTDDARHLWPHYFRLVNAIRPDLCVGEQVAAAIGKNWLDGVFADLESADYACEAFVLPACSVNAPHRRDRIWFAAARGALGDCLRTGLEGHAGNVDGWTGWASEDRPVAEAGGGGAVADSERGRREAVLRSSAMAGEEGSQGRTRHQLAEQLAAGRELGDVADADQPGTRQGWQQRSGQLSGAGCYPQARNGGAWADADWIIGHDGKARRIPAIPQSALRGVADGVPAGVDGLRADGNAEEIQSQVITLLASGVPARVGKLKALGNAIVPQVGAEFIGALMECMP